MKTIYKSCFILFVSLFTLPAFAQNFEKAYGGTGYEVPYATLQTSDGGYITAGVTTSFGAIGYDIYLVKTTSIGEISWSKRYGGGGSETAQDIKQTADGGFIVAGETTSFGAGNSDFFLMKTNATGDVMWAKTYGGTGADQATSVINTKDNGYFVFGLTTSFGVLSNTNFYGVKTDGSGNVVFSKVISSPSGPVADEGIKAIQISDDSYGLYGRTQNDKLLFVNISVTGAPLFNKMYTLTGGYAKATDFEESADGGFIFTGYGNTVAFVDNGFLLKTQRDGTVSWARKYGTAGVGGIQDSRSHAVTRTGDGFIFVGSGLPSNATSTAQNNCLWVKTDLMGLNPITHVYGGSNAEIVYGRTRLTTDNGFVYSAVTFSYGPGDRDILLIKTDATGAISGTPGNTCVLSEPPANLLTAVIVFDATAPAVVYDDPITISNTFIPVEVPVTSVKVDVCPNVVLPVRAFQFFASQNGNGVVVKWQTNYESDVKQYEVERASDGINFTAIKNVIGKNGISNEYVTVDHLPFTGKNYYRIKTTETSGAVFYSEVKFVDFTKKSTIPVHITPNPITDHSRINAEGASGINMQFIVFDVAGRRISITNIKGNQPFDFYKGNLKSGFYTYQVKENSGIIATGKFIIK